MDTGDFERLIHSHKHPRLHSIGLIAHTSSQANNPREARGILDPHGSIWACEDGKTRHMIRAIRLGYILPFGNVGETVWDDEWQRYVYKHDRMRPANVTTGWHAALEGLLKDGYQRPGPVLSRLLRRRSREIPLRQWRIW
jgi:hypothetical protein